MISTVRGSERKSFAHRVGKVLLPAIFGVHRCQRAVDAARCQYSVRVFTQPLPHNGHFTACFIGCNCSAQSGRARANHQNI